MSAMKGTTASETLAMRLTPPMRTSATMSVRIAPETMVETVYFPPRKETVCEGIISFTAEEMELT